MKFKTIVCGLFLLPMFFLSACNKQEDGSGVPLVNVNISIFTSSPEFINLTVVGGWEYITGGSRGILIYRLTNDLFLAYDRHCTFEPDKACARVEVDPATLLVVDPCCESEFAITDGTVLSGPATIPLKQYGTSWDGEVLRIFN